MKQLSSIKKLLKEYGLTKPELLKILHQGVHYYLSEEELQKFIKELYFKKEAKINKKLQV